MSKVLPKYHRNCVKTAAKTPTSSAVLSLAILQANIEINVTKSQFCIIIITSEKLYVGDCESVLKIVD